MNVQTVCGVSKKGKFICLRMSLGICTLEGIFIQIHVHAIGVAKKRELHCCGGAGPSACELESGSFLLQKHSCDSTALNYRALALSNIV